MNVRTWLNNLGLGQHAVLFEENDIDAEVLGALTEADLQSIGLSLGHRKKLLAAIAVLDPSDTVAAPPPPPSEAERAVRAALAIVAAVKDVAAPAPVQVRVGIATGPVVVGETGAGDASIPKLAAGETPNIAARIQGLAGPDEIAIAPTTRRILGGTFEIDELGEHALKGIVEPLSVARVVGVSAAEGRFAAAHTGQIGALGGRDAEMAMLADRWQRAQDGEGQVITLCGEPGIGKSRLVQGPRRRRAA